MQYLLYMAGNLSLATAMCSYIVSYLALSLLGSLINHPLLGLQLVTLGAFVAVFMACNCDCDSVSWFRLLRFFTLIADKLLKAIIFRANYFQ